MALTPDLPFPKSPGDTIRSDDWNDAVNEVIRLDNDKVNKAGDAMTGPLTVAGDVVIGAPSPQAKLQVSGGAIMPAAGNTEQAGIMFPKDPGGGSGDAAWIRYYPRSGEATTLEIGTSNDNNDHIALMATGNVGIGITNPDQTLHVHKGSAGTVTAASASIAVLENNTHGWLQFLTPDTSSAGILFGDPAKVDSGWVIYRHNTNELDFATNGIKRLWIKDDGKVGIGTSAPDQTLHIHKGSAGSVTAHTDSVAVMESNTYGYLQLLTPANRSGGILFGDPDSTVEGYVLYDHSSDQLRFATSRSTRMYIKSDGHIGIGTSSPGDDRLDVRGRCYSSGGWQTTNADYAEYFESHDNKAIRVATSVILTDDGKIRAAKKGEQPIGITTSNSAVVGNSYKEWPKKYLRDKFGQIIMEKVKEEIQVPKKKKIKKDRQKTKKETVTEDVAGSNIVLEKGKYIQKEVKETVTREIEVPVFEEVDLYDSSGKVKIGTHKVPVMETYEEEEDVVDEDGSPVLIGSGEFVSVERPKLNPDYDETKVYVPRSERSEWCCVGLLGQLALRKDKPVAESWVKIKDLSDGVELWLVK